VSILILQSIIANLRSAIDPFQPMLVNIDEEPIS
jgi:hypothetical protein